MAGEGLFFAGTVLKNNRDLIKEDMAREELAIKKEQLELQKQAATDKRKDARSKGQKANLQDYSLDGINPLFVSDFQSNVGGYQDFANNNAVSIYDGDAELKNEQSSLERNLHSLTNNYGHLSSDITSLDSLVKNNKGGQLKLAENGEYLYVHNMGKINEVTQGENAISMSEALELYPIDAQSMINKTTFKNPINALYDAKGSDMTTITNADGSQYKTLGDVSGAGEDTISGLTPDKNGNWDNPYMEKLYLGKEGLTNSEGLEFPVSFPEAFAFETRGIDIAGSTTFTDKLNPGSETYEPELANEYIQFIKNKSEEKARRNYPNQLIKAKAEGTDNDADLSIDASKILLGSTEKTKSFGEANIKFSPNQYDDLTNEQITVSLSSESLIKEQGSAKLEEYSTSLQVWNSDNTGVDAQGKVIYTGITESNQPVAAVEFSGQMYLIPLASLSSSVKKKIKNAGGTSLDLFKIAEGGSQSSSKTDSNGVGSKYKKKG